MWSQSLSQCQEQHTQPFNPQYYSNKHHSPSKDQWSSERTPLQPQNSTALFQQQHQLFPSCPQYVQHSDNSAKEPQQFSYRPQFIQNDVKLNKDTEKPLKENESWTQFSSKFQNSRKRPRESPSPLGSKCFSLFGSVLDDGEEKPKSLWSLIGESPKRKRTSIHRQSPVRKQTSIQRDSNQMLKKSPVLTQRQKNLFDTQRKLASTPEPKDLLDSNSWFHVSPLFTSTPVKKTLEQEELMIMDRSPAQKISIKCLVSDQNDGNEVDINEVLTESCFITPRTSSMPRFRSLTNTLTPDSYMKETTALTDSTNFTSYGEETLNTSFDGEHETTNAETTANFVTPKKVRLNRVNSLSAGLEMARAENATIFITPKKVPSKQAASYDGAHETNMEMDIETPKKDHETTNLETTTDYVTPRKPGSKQITDFFQRVESKAKTPPQPSRLPVKKTPSYTPYLSPIEETSTDMVHDSVLEKKMESDLANKKIEPDFTHIEEE